MIHVTLNCAADGSRLLEVCAEGLRLPSSLAHLCQTNTLRSWGACVYRCSPLLFHLHELLKTTLKMDGSETILYDAIKMGPCCHTFA